MKLAREYLQTTQACDVGLIFHPQAQGAEYAAGRAAFNPKLLCACSFSRQQIALPTKLISFPAIANCHLPHTRSSLFTQLLKLQQSRRIPRYFCLQALPKDRIERLPNDELDTAAQPPPKLPQFDLPKAALSLPAFCADCVRLSTKLRTPNP